ncbi:MAG: ribonuclease III [Spirochaetaceae bacterium]|jgi:ribonuclease-3|nr:ribonuclease III [Spirochaetaceae bacterium]
MLTNSSSLSKSRKQELVRFQRTVGIKFNNLSLLNYAFLHRSVANETSVLLKAGGVGGMRPNNERLEFLGDAVLGTVAATLLYNNLPDKQEGDLAKIKAVVVSEDILSGLALQLQIDNLLVLGRGEELSGGRTKKALLADAMEALIGALYLDGGFKSAYAFVSKIIEPEISKVVEKRSFQDFKSQLQELCQKKFRKYPVYKLLKKTGPEHERFFWIEVNVAGIVYGPGMGRNKKNAEQEAARAALSALNKE